MEDGKLLIGSNTVMVASSTPGKSQNSFSGHQRHQRHEVKKFQDQLDILLPLHLGGRDQDEAHGRPGRHDRHDGQDHEHAASQVTTEIEIH